jgi:SAM-dependent methyltransferase
LTSIHPTAAQGFLKPQVYDRGRPNYPVEILEPLDVDSSTTVVDLGCGTGKLTKLLTTTTALVIGIDPLPTMLDAFDHKSLGVRVINGTAEAIPLRSRTAGVVVCASAFHWFDHDRAIPEIHRVLEPDGRLVIIWNRRDELSGWPAEFWAITEAHRGDTPGYKTDKWRHALEASPLFGPIHEHWFENKQVLDLEGILARVQSISFIETLPPNEHRRVIDDCRRFLETHPETQGRDVFELPYRTVVYVSQSR